jgi:competence protein ComEA
MWRSSSKREMLAWTAILCLLGFGCGFVLVKRFRPAGPVEFRELPSSNEVKVGQIPPAFTPKPVDNLKPAIPVPEPTAPPVATTTDAVSPTAPPAIHNKSKAEPDTQSISINSGDLTELEKLPGVGPSLAQKIIDYRTEHGPFQSTDDLRNVRGIGEKRLAKIAPYVRL